MGIVHEFDPEAILPFPAVLVVRVAVARAPGQRHNYYVKVERRGNDDVLFDKALREFRTVHGPVERVVSIDLYPNG